MCVWMSLRVNILLQIPLLQKHADLCQFPPVSHTSDWHSNALLSFFILFDKLASINPISPNHVSNHPAYAAEARSSNHAVISQLRRPSSSSDSHQASRQHRSSHASISPVVRFQLPPILHQSPAPILPLNRLSAPHPRRDTDAAHKGRGDERVSRD